MKLMVSGVVLVSFLFAGCSKEPPNPAAVGPAEAEVAASKQQAPAVDEKVPAKPAAPVSRHAALRESVKGFVDLAVKCEKRWVSKVDPSKLDKWELPVDVSSMEDECDKLIFDHEEMVKTCVFKGPELDALVLKMAMVTDLYSHLAFRCRRVGVKDRIPFKKMLSDLRDSLSREIRELADDSGKVLKLSDDELIRADSGQALIARADGHLSRIARDMKDFIVEPRRDKGPVFKYCLKVSGGLAAKSSEALSADSEVDGALKEAATALATAWTTVSDFYAGDYLAEEEAKSGFLQKSVTRAASSYEKVARKFRADN